MFTLDDGVGEMGCADHHTQNAVVGNLALLEHVLQRGDDPARHIRSSRSFVPVDDPRTVHQDGIRIRPADIDTNPHGLS